MPEKRFMGELEKGDVLFGREILDVYEISIDTETGPLLWFELDEQGRGGSAFANEPIPKEEDDDDRIH